MRTAPLLAEPKRDRVADHQVLRSHVRAIKPSDPFFFLSHRHYLARGLRRDQRIEAARRHYEHEAHSFGPDYHQQVYRGTGLLLWHRAVGGHHYEIRLGPGADVLYEGGLSVVLYVDGERVAVMSYSYVDSDMIFGRTDGPGGASPTTLFITRKQLTGERGYQRDFFAAFNRCTAAHFCHAALSAIASAQGIEELAGIRPEVHPGHKPERHDHLVRAYSDFWHSLRGVPEGPFAYRVPMPMTLTPLSTLSSKARRRAKRRRRHLQQIHEEARAVIVAHLRGGN